MTTLQWAGHLGKDCILGCCKEAGGPGYFPSTLSQALVPKGKLICLVYAQPIAAVLVPFAFTSLSGHLVEHSIDLRKHLMRAAF